MANQYVVGSKDVQIWLKFNDIPAIKVETGTSVNSSKSRSMQDIYAIGTEDPIDTDGTNRQYTRSFSLQTGELNSILDAINSAVTVPYATMMDVPPFVMSVVHSMRNSAIPKTVVTSYLNCLVESETEDVDRNNVETISTLSLRGTGIQRSVLPIT